ncbi:glutaredoxin [candidate division WOR-1 bacterium RIFCSPHIGHO2_02_FULL_53_26]|nr:MAG: glutaredoxin [candidate division WOR-1 bacterium RIFCSPHIGHO2_02_FULL_53_26]
MAEIKILTTPGCAACAAVERVLEKIKPEYPDLKIEIVDLTERPEYLERYPILSAPGVVINGKLEFVGGATEKDLREKLEGK